MSAETTTRPAATVQTIRWAEWVYGRRGASLADPAEEYHESSKLSRRVVEDGTHGARLLEASAEMRITAARAVKRYRNLPEIRLPPPRVPRTGLADVMATRRSERSFEARPLRLVDLATLLAAGYGVTATLPTGQPVRSVPSGGALYPLELYVAASSVSGLEPALYHFDPFRGTLARLRSLPSRNQLGELSPYGELLADPAAVVFVTAMFWRTRFKYGLRGYRFALLEAGHVGQNVLLAAAALELAALPLGGIYDRDVEALLGIDGVNESVVYGFSIGVRPDERAA